MTAARSAPSSDPANNQLRRPMAGLGAGGIEEQRHALPRRVVFVARLGIAGGQLELHAERLLAHGLDHHAVGGHCLEVPRKAIVPRRA